VALRWTRELLDLERECEITPYRSSGPGGQKKNKTESSVRVVHRPSGLVRIATESRSQSANRLLALDRIRQALEIRRRRPKPRHATTPTAGSQVERLKEKARTSAIKRARQRPDPES
jgi:ribosome-associated protein